jgi:oxygen-dependent protoporphyrinogen oxidase
MIGIIGGGITGLSLHHYLAQHDVKSTVFEAADEPGGVLRTIHKDGHVLECGPQRTRLSPVVHDLVEAVGLSDHVVEAADVPLYVYNSGTLGRVPLSFRAAVTTDLLTWRGKLRILLEPFTNPPQEDETVETYLMRAFGHEFATRVGGPLYAGLYASDPDEMPVEHSIRRALERFGIGRSVLFTLLQTQLKGRSPPPAVSFRNGMQDLPRALYEHYSDNVSLNAPVRLIGETDHSYELATDDTTTLVDEVVITTPAPTAASLLEPIDPDSAEALRNLTYNPLAVVHLHADASLDGAGHQIPFAEPYVTLGVTWNDSLFGRENHTDPETLRAVSAATGREGVYTCFLGGAKTPEAEEWSDDRLGAIAATEFEEMTGVPAEPLHVHRLSLGMPAYDHSWDALRHVDPPAGIHLCANYESRAGIPGRVDQGKQLATALATGSEEVTRSEVPRYRAIRE